MRLVFKLARKPISTPRPLANLAYFVQTRLYDDRCVYFFPEITRRLSKGIVYVVQLLLLLRIFSTLDLNALKKHQNNCMRTYLIYSNFPECFCNVAAATRTLYVCSQRAGGRSGGGNKYKYIYIYVVTRYYTANDARRASR